MKLLGRTITPRSRSTVAVLVAATCAVVHSTGSLSNVGVFAAESKSGAEPKTSRVPMVNGRKIEALAELPTPVAEMREAILAAVRSGDIEELRTPLEWNEMRPIIADKDVGDPIAHWKATSADGQGREVLAVLGRMLDSGFAKEPFGRDAENNAVYVWPYLATADLANLTPAQEVDLYRLMPVAEAKAMRDKKKWTWWRLAIGADGTWHTFMRSE